MGAGAFSAFPPMLDHAATAEMLRQSGVMLGLYRASRAGEFATVDPTLERLLGRRPLGMRDLMAEKAGG